MKPRPASMSAMLGDNDQMNTSTSINKAAATDNEFEFPGRHMSLHAKIFVIDDKAVWIGSYNVHPRSYHLDTEIGLIIRDKKFSVAMKKIVTSDMAPGNSWTLGLRPKILLLSEVNKLFIGISYHLKLADAWPFRATSLYELKDGKEPLDFDHPDFHKHYRDVGKFPQVDKPVKVINTRLLKVLGGLALPLI